MKSFIKIIVILFFFQNLNALQQNSFLDKDKLDNFINENLKIWEIPGLAVAVIKDGDIILSKGYGFVDQVKASPVDEHTLFSIASNTKSFTATLSGILYDEKILDLEKPVKEYFPEFEMYDDCITDKVTLKDMMCHRTGIGREEFHRLNRPENRESVMKSLKYFQPLVDFRSQFLYSNYGFTVAGYLMAQLAGSTWEELLTQKILNPIGMTETKFSVTDMPKFGNYAKPHIDWGYGTEEMELHNEDLLGPAGSIVSNITDMAKWVTFNLDKGSVDDQQIINPNTLAYLQRPYMSIASPLKYPEKSYLNYGLGWFVDFYRGRLHINHGGVLYGFTSLVSFMPDENIGIVILMNLNNCNFVYSLEGYIYDELLKLDPVNWNERYLEYNEKLKEYFRSLNESKADSSNISAPPTLDLEDYTGTYKSNGYGEIEIALEDNTLKARLSAQTCNLNHIDKDEFNIYDDIGHRPWKTTFIVEDNSVKALNVEVEEKLNQIKFIKVE